MWSGYTCVKDAETSSLRPGVSSWRWRNEKGLAPPRSPRRRARRIQGRSQAYGGPVCARLRALARLPAVLGTWRKNVMLSSLLAFRFFPRSSSAESHSFTALTQPVSDCVSFSPSPPAPTSSSPALLFSPASPESPTAVSAAFKEASSSGDCCAAATSETCVLWCQFATDEAIERLLPATATSIINGMTTKHTRKMRFLHRGVRGVRDRVAGVLPRATGSIEGRCLDAQAHRRLRRCWLRTGESCHSRANVAGSSPSRSHGNRGSQGASSIGGVLN